MVESESYGIVVAETNTSAFTYFPVSISVLNQKANLNLKLDWVKLY